MIWDRQVPFKLCILCVCKLWWVPIPHVDPSSRAAAVELHLVLHYTLLIFHHRNLFHKLWMIFPIEFVCELAFAPVCTLAACMRICAWIWSHSVFMVLASKRPSATELLRSYVLHSSSELPAAVALCSSSELLATSALHFCVAFFFRAKGNVYVVLLRCVLLQNFPMR